MEQKSEIKGQIIKQLNTGFAVIARIVLGILIAIQINSWNGERKRVNFEVKILTQISANLQKDSLALAQISLNAIDAVSSGNKVLASSSITTNDSIQYWLADVIYFDRFNSLTNGFEVLKAKGLDQVSNKKLCFLLGAYYDNETQLIDRGLNDVEWTFTNEWLRLLRKDIVDFSFHEYLIVDDYKLFTEHGEVRNLLKMTVENWKGSAYYVDDGITSIKEILTIIEDEIKEE